MRLEPKRLAEGMSADSYGISACCDGTARSSPSLSPILRLGRMVGGARLGPRQPRPAATTAQPRPPASAAAKPTTSRSARSAARHAARPEMPALAGASRPNTARAWLGPSHPFQALGRSRACALATVQPTAAVGHSWRPARLPAPGLCTAAGTQLRHGERRTPVRQAIDGVVPRFFCHTLPLPLSSPTAASSAP
jgi:hypothetical protein